MAVKRLYEREYGLEILVGDPQVQLGDDTILDILDGDLRGCLLYTSPSPRDA